MAFQWPCDFDSNVTVTKSIRLITEWNKQMWLHTVIYQTIHCYTDLSVTKWHGCLSSIRLYIVTLVYQWQNGMTVYQTIHCYTGLSVRNWHGCQSPITLYIVTLIYQWQIAWLSIIYHIIQCYTDLSVTNSMAVNHLSRYTFCYSDQSVRKWAWQTTTPAILKSSVSSSFFCPFSLVFVA